MKFNSEIEAKYFGMSIGATHYKFSGDDYRFIKHDGGIHPIIPTHLINEYLSINDPPLRIIALAHQRQAKADLVWFDNHKQWFAYECNWSCSGFLCDDKGVKKI